VRHRLPWLVLVLVIGACDLKPAPRKKVDPAAAAAAPVPAPGAQAPGAQAPGAQALGAQAPEDPAQACMQVGVRVADVLVASAADAVLRAQFEQERANTVRSTAEAGMRGEWDAALRQCFLTAATQPQLDACKARAPGPAISRPTRGS
jgi:hypothetical protein